MHDCFETAFIFSLPLSTICIDTYVILKWLWGKTKSVLPAQKVTNSFKEQNIES